MNVVYNCDCMEYMKTLPDKYFELAIVDPPYFDGPNFGTYYHGGNSKKIVTYREIKTWKIPTQIYHDELKRISKNQIVWGINYFNFQDVPCGRNIWIKNNSNSTFSDCEIASNSLINSVKSFSYTWDGFRQDDMKNKEIKIHLTQKPVALYRWILQNYANPNDKIFDSHVGSGSSRIAAYELDFYYEGCELDKDYWEAQEKRFKLEKAKIDNEFYIPENEENQLFTGVM